MGVPLKLSIGDQNLVIDPDRITLRKVKELAKSMTDVRAKHSTLIRHPMLEGETVDAYDERVKKERKESLTKQEGESDEDLARRLLTSESDNQSFVFDCLRAVAVVFDQSQKVTEETYDQVPYVGAKKFIEDLLDMCDLN